MTLDEVLAESTFDIIKNEYKHKCGTVLMAAKVHHSNHIMPQALAGDGSVQVQTVPYCPDCHEKPSNYGAPITPGMREWPVVDIKVKAS